MNLIHYQDNCSSIIKKIPKVELKRLGINNSKFLLPSNPVVYPDHNNIRIAFLGLNAYANDKDFLNASEYRNFTEWCQENYNGRFKTVMNLYNSNIDQKYFDDGAIYFSNFVKVVLREKYFKTAAQVEKVLANCQNSKKLFESVIKTEIHKLTNIGCKVFICFGDIVYEYISKIFIKPEFILIKSYHFSRYTKRNIIENVNKINDALR